MTIDKIIKELEGAEDPGTDVCRTAALILRDLVNACEVTSKIFDREPDDAADFKDASQRILAAWHKSRAVLSKVQA